MDNWQWWVALAVTSLAGFWIGALRDGKKRDAETDDRLFKRVADLEERTAVIEATQIGPDRVKLIVSESMEVTNVKLDKIESTLESLSTNMLNVQLAIARQTNMDHQNANDNS